MKLAGKTDVGRVRQDNQDDYRAGELPGDAAWLLVCDGMGGARGGREASQSACDVIERCFQEQYASKCLPGEEETFLKKSLLSANRFVFQKALREESLAGMGTTAVLALIENNVIHLVNVGDSRAYAIDRTGIRQLTKDHSLVQMMVERGELTPERARTYPGKNFITRAVGTESVLESDLFHYRLSRGDCLLLCSDGLSNMMDDQEILFEVVHGVNKQLCCQRLLDIAKSRGAPDNVTSILVQV